MLIVLYLLAIVSADVLAANYMVHLPWGLYAPAGAFAIAPIFTLRDSLHRKYGPTVVVWLILIASGISLVLSFVTGNEMLSTVTIASVAAFFVSEFADTIIYQRLHRQTWLQRALVSNTVSGLLDSLIFITWAFGFALAPIAGQYLVKLVLSSAVALVLARYYRRARDQGA